MFTLECICIPKEVVAAMKKKLESGSELKVEDVKKRLEFSSTSQPLYELPVNRVLFDGIKNQCVVCQFFGRKSRS